MTPPKQPNTSPFKLTYGEETKLPLTVKAAAFHVTAATSQRAALVEACLTVCNDSIAKDIEATLQFPLPDSDATVCGFSVGKDRAIAVPKAKAAEVAYKERERGRAVATAHNAQGAVYEATVHPLPPGVAVPVELQFVCALAPASESAGGRLALHVPLVFDRPVATVTVAATAEDGSTVSLGAPFAADGTARDTTLPDGVRLSVESGAQPPRAPAAAVAAKRRNKLYWSGYLAKEAIDEALNEVAANLDALATGKPLENVVRPASPNERLHRRH